MEIIGQFMFDVLVSKIHRKTSGGQWNQKPKKSMRLVQMFRNGMASITSSSF